MVAVLTYSLQTLIDASFHKVIEDLQRVSPQFRLWWEQQDVRGLPDGPRTMHHPTLGVLEFDHVTSRRPSLLICAWKCMRPHPHGLQVGTGSVRVLLMRALVRSGAPKLILYFYVSMPPKPAGMPPRCPHQSLPGRHPFRRVLNLDGGVQERYAHLHRQ